MLRIILAVVTCSRSISVLKRQSNRNTSGCGYYIMKLIIAQILSEYLEEASFGEENLITIDIVKAIHQLAAISVPPSKGPERWRWSATQPLVVGNRDQCILQ